MHITFTTVCGMKKLTIKTSDIENLDTEIKNIKNENPKNHIIYNIPEMRKIFQLIQSVMILLIRIVLYNLPINQINQLVSTDVYNKISYFKILYSLADTPKIQPVISFIHTHIQMNMKINVLNITGAIKVDEKIHPFMLRLEKQKNKWIIKRINYVF